MIHKAEALCEQSQYSIARQNLRTQRTVLGETLKHKILIKKFEDYISHLENTRPTSEKIKNNSSSSSSSSHFVTEIQANKTIELLDDLIYEFNKLKLPIQKFIDEKVKLYYQTAAINIHKQNYTAAMLAMQKGREFIQEPGPDPFAKMGFLIEQMRRQ